MHLIMYLNGELIDSIEINNSLLQKIKILQQELEEKHSQILDLSTCEPTFFLEGMPSGMNEDKFPKKIIYN